MAANEHYPNLRSHQRLPIYNQSSTVTCNTSRIPHRLIFTHYYTTMSHLPQHFYQNVQTTIRHYRASWNNSQAPVDWYNDDDCRQALRTLHPRLVPHFDREHRGMIRGDMCRLAALFRTGGYYFDVDMRILEPLTVTDNVCFVSVLAWGMTELFQSFLGATPRHPVIWDGLNVMLEYYEQYSKGQQSYVHNLGAWALHSALARAPPGQKSQVLLLNEIALDRHPLYDNLERQNGTGGGCNYAVEDPRTQRVVFFSRIVGAGQYCQDPSTVPVPLVNDRSPFSESDYWDSDDRSYDGDAPCYSSSSSSSSDDCENDHNHMTSEA